MVLPAIHHADEVWQYLEPAHHLVSGRWVETWDFRAGIRTWLIPELITAPMALGDVLAPGCDLGVTFAKAFCAILSLSIVASAVALGRDVSPTHGLVAGIVTATWMEFVYFGAHVLSDSIALDAFFPAAWLLTTRSLDRRVLRFSLAGLLLGLCFALRFQLAPALIVIAIGGARTDWRRAWLPLIAGAAGGLAIDAVTDLIAGQTPYVYMLNNYVANIVQHKAATFGTQPAAWYVLDIARRWSIATPVILLLALIGARRFPALGLAAAVHLALHMIVAHKEYRYVLLSATTVLFLAAIGTGDTLSLIHRRYPATSARRWSAAACMGWMICSAALATIGPFRKEWTRQKPMIVALQIAARAPGLCGLALYRPPAPLSAAYSFYDRDTPIYEFVGADARRRALGGALRFNVVIAPYGAIKELGQGYSPGACTSHGHPDTPAPYCVSIRPGGCGRAPWSDDEVNQVMARIGK